jgi:N-methylhydantoinase B
VYEVGLKDAFYVRWNGGGGYGDPLERDPASVCKDVIEGTVSREAARDLYGVIVKDDHLDMTQTEALRRALRDRRIGRGAAA